MDRSLRSLDASLPLEIKTWTSELDTAVFAARVVTVALGVLGLLEVMLAVTGIFGMASYVVTKRLRELGIRVALGASQRKVLSAALGRPPAARHWFSGGDCSGIAGYPGSFLHRLPGDP